MATLLNESSGYLPAPTGTHPARCIKVIDLGTQETPFGKKAQFFFEWELGEFMDDGRPFTVGRFYTASLNSKAALREDLESWRGALSKANFPFDVTQMIRQACLITVKHAETEDSLRARIASIAALPKGMEAPAKHNDALVFTFDSPDEQVLDKLPDWMTNKIRSAPEWGRKDLEPETESEFDDEIPVV